MLNELSSNDNQKWNGVGPPKRGLPRLAKAVDQSQDEKIKDFFEVCSLSPPVPYLYKKYLVCSFHYRNFLCH